MRTLLIVIVLVVLAGGGYYWYTQNQASTVDDTDMSNPFGENDDMSDMDMDSDTNSTATTSSGTNVNVNASGSVSTGTTKEFTVHGKPFSFTPATMTVKKGDTVKITFINDQGQHDWKIDEFNAATKVIQAGQQETITFVADKTGSFEYYCSVGNHRAMGMKGTLTVTN